MRRFLTSPLVATFSVLFTLGVLAVPLKRLTSQDRPQPVKMARETTKTSLTATWVQVKWLAEVADLRLATLDGRVLWEIGESGAGQADFPAELPIVDGGLELRLSANFVGDLESAVFISLAPDHLEERSAHLLGMNEVTGVVSFEWPPPHSTHEP